MNPEPLSAAHWQMLFSGLISLTFFVGFVILGALSFLLAYGVIPSVLYPPLDIARLRYQRYGLYAVGAAAFAAALYQIARAIALVIPVINDIYPRWWI